TFSSSTNTNYYMVLSDNCSPKNDTAYFSIYPDTLFAYVKSNLLNQNTFTDTVICEGQNITLHGIGEGGATNNYQFTWFNSKNDSLGTANNFTFSPTENEDYFMVLDDQCLLKTDTTHFSIFLNPPLQSVILSLSNSDNKYYTAPSDTTLCFGAEITLGVLGSGGDSTNYGYRWSVDGNQLSTADTVTLSLSKSDTSLQVRLILTDNCTVKSDTAEINLHVLPALKLNATVKDTLCLGETAFA